MRKLTISLLAVLGCAHVDITDRGRTVETVPAAPAGCENLGPIFGQGGGAFTVGGVTSNARLMEYAVNDARNKAAELGASHVVLASPALGTSGNAVTTATVSGVAYRCPPAAR